jgi:hypothetical protein
MDEQYCAAFEKELHKALLGSPVQRDGALDEHEQAHRWVAWMMNGVQPRAFVHGSRPRAPARTFRLVGQPPGAPPP